ncbi:MAG: sodium:proton antiporter [Pirellulaceae bacterium]|nr:sodium:proton antiporter [Pirellulaceae bacterium]
MVALLSALLGSNLLASPAQLAQAAAPKADGHPASEHAGNEHAAGDHAAAGQAGGHGHGEMGKKLPEWTVIPFATLLLCIAILPLFAGHWWEHNFHQNKAIIVAALSAIVAIYLVYSWGQEGIAGLQHTVTDYISFMILLGSLFLITGGIYVTGSLNGTPLANTAIMAIGAVIANFIGTTGASVLLVRPFLRANKTRQNKAHLVIFFIFVVSNCGGLLTPLGDPPLFMGFTAGVPFEWTLFNLWPMWFLVNAALLLIFNIWDQIVFAKEEKARPGSQLEEVMKHEPLGIRGGLNFLFLAGVVAAVYFKGIYNWPWGVQEGIMALMAILGYFTTASANREANKFSFGPIVEVAILFIGIFITMTPALQILNAWGSGDRQVLGMGFGMSEPWQFFWASGSLSSFLDNAPTYITMAATAAGLKGIAADGQYLREFLALGPDAARLLAAISCGAVFMGANTYIGNGPNFMVKAIAEENGVKMPSFFGYMIYSGLILLPLFVVVTLVFFRG